MKSKIIDMYAWVKEEEDKITLRFLNTVSKLNTIEIIGVARLLGIRVIEDMILQENEKPTFDKLFVRPSQDIVAELLDAFRALDSKSKKKILDITRAAK